METRIKAKRISILIFSVIICCLFGGALTIYARGGSAKTGTYSSISAGYVTDGTGTISISAFGTNKTTSTRFMTTSIQAYKKTDGSLYDQTRVSLNTGAGVTRERTLDNIPDSCNVWAQNILYTGTSISTVVLESLRIKVN